MTDCTKPVTRKTQVEYQGRPIVVTVKPKFVTVKLLGLREEFSMPIAALYEAAVKLKAIDERNGR